MALYKWFVTTPLGIEDVSAHEIEGLVGSRAEADVGKVFFEAGLEAMYLVNFSARTINRLYLLLARERFGGLEDIYRIARDIDYTSVIAPGRSFAVRCERIGLHGFTSIDVARVVGQAVIDSYRASRGERPPVDLESPDTEIGVLVRDDEVIIGVNTTGESLHKRRYRVYNHPAALKTTLAAAMLYIGGYRGQPLLDPLCGGGTIPIEAAHIARRYPVSMFRRDYGFRALGIHDVSVEERVLERLYREVGKGLYRITCIDISSRHIEGARLNARSAGVEDTIEFVTGDATRRETYRGVEAELVATNPPYGMRSHNIKKIGLFYRDLLETLRDVYRGSRAVVITASTRQLEEAIEKTDTEVLSSRRVMHGGLEARIYLLRL